MSSNTAIIIPARLAAVRLPNKPLANIGDVPIVIRVANQAKSSNAGDVFIAACEDAVYNIAKKYNFEAIKTEPTLASGTDRVYAAFKDISRNYKYIINLQGDLPLIDPQIISATKDLLAQQDIEIATAAVEITEHNKENDPNIVKAILTQSNQALYFTRATAPFGPGKLYEHIGIYGYTPESLEKFVKAPQTLLEKRERLEQLRALEHGIKIHVTIVDSAPISVDTPENLERARTAFKLSAKN
ncbi:MAG: 3-deoxy-manno-octulosonate cytidylyltransferase [Candidatus Midichloria sp.]|nr:MAG: 3-deoxy-manno-octulosonate cytidylyltransferase [Candidatus Midichloria sp.]